MMSKCINLSEIMKNLHQKIRQIPNEAFERDGRTVLVHGGRSYGEKVLQNYAILKTWPAGTIAHATKDGVRYSELADAEEIKD